MGTSRYLKERNPEVQIVGLQPSEGSSIAGIRRWPQAYLPKIFDVGVRALPSLNKDTPPAFTVITDTRLPSSLHTTLFHVFSKTVKEI